MSDTSISNTNPFLAIMEASASLQEAQLDNEKINANTTKLQANKLNDVYSSANDALQKFIDGLNPKSSSNQIQEITAHYNLASSKYSNYENVLSSNVQTQETQTQGIAQDQKMSVQFAMDATGVESYTGNLLASRLG